MEGLPDWAAQALIIGIVTFVFKVVFGLINKNETKSDEAIKEINKDIGNLETKFVDNDRDLYGKVSAVETNAAYYRGVHDTERENK